MMTTDQWRVNLLLALRSKLNKSQMISYLENFRYTIYTKRNQAAGVKANDSIISDYNAMLHFSGEVLDFIDNEHRPDEMAFDSDFQELKFIAEKLVERGEMSADVLTFFL